MKQVLKSIVALLKALKSIPDFDLKTGHEKLVLRYVAICKEVSARYARDEGHKSWSLITSAVKLGNDVYNSFVSLVLGFANGAAGRWENIEKTIKAADPTKIDLESYQELASLKERFQTLFENGKADSEDKLQSLVSLVEAMNAVSHFLNIRVLELGSAYKEAESRLRFEKRHARNVEVSEDLLAATKELEDLLAA